MVLEITSPSRPASPASTSEVETFHPLVARGGRTDIHQTVGDVIVFPVGTPTRPVSAPILSPPPRPGRRGRGPGRLGGLGLTQGRRCALGGRGTGSLRGV